MAGLIKPQGPSYPYLQVSIHMLVRNLNIVILAAVYLCLEGPKPGCTQGLHLALYS